MKKISNIAPVLIAASSLIALFFFNQNYRTSAQPGIPVYKLRKDGTKELIRFIPVEDAYFPQGYDSLTATEAPQVKV